MKMPFYLGVRSLTSFETALRDVNTDELRALLAKPGFGKADALNPRKQQLVEAEIARRKSAAMACWVVMLITAYSCAVSLLSS